jgi:hypothetical protein
MPKLFDLSQMEAHQLPSSGFQYSAVRPDTLGATEYTLVTVALDVSGSVEPFADELLNTLKAAVNACKKSPKSENILLRVMTFNGAVVEVHGFLPLDGLDPDAYNLLVCSGGTALFDAVYSSVGAARDYADVLIRQDYAVNAIGFIITDGEDNSSSLAADAIRQLTEGLLHAERLSVLTVLVGVNSGKSQGYLKDFQTRAGLDQYIDLGDVSTAQLAKLGGFISRSVSSQSQAIGGGPVNLSDLTF